MNQMKMEIIFQIQFKEETPVSRNLLSLNTNKAEAQRIAAAPQAFQSYLLFIHLNQTIIIFCRHN